MNTQNVATCFALISALCENYDTNRPTHILTIDELDFNPQDDTRETKMCGKTSQKM